VVAERVGRPVLLRWTREEEFTWAYFRPAGIIDIEAALDDQHKITSWYMLNINSGGSAIETPYSVAQHHEQEIGADAPLRQGSYRALAATANTFARESAMDELAAAASVDPLEFRLAHLDRGRLREVLEEAARRFDWRERWKQAKQPSDARGAIGIGLACGTEKGSFVSACVEVAVDPESKRIDVVHVCEVFECGAITTPDNLRSQVEGAIIMGLGPALEEEIRLADNTIENPTFRRYRVPRFSHTPTLDIQLLDRLDLPSVGGGETPIIAIAPAIANAVCNATGQRIRQMPMRLA
jgi:isoquinoline 1-oxidoreductase